MSTLVWTDLQHLQNVTIGSSDLAPAHLCLAHTNRLEWEYVQTAVAEELAVFPPDNWNKQIVISKSFPDFF